MRSGGKYVQRPLDKVEFMDKLLTSKPYGAFDTLRDVLVFAAALGFKEGRRKPFDPAPNPIEWGTMVNRFGTEELVAVVAYCETEEVDILGPERAAERIKIFEEYANGGLEILHEAMNRDALLPSEAVQRIVGVALEDEAGGEGTSRAQDAEASPAIPPGVLNR